MANKQTTSLRKKGLSLRFNKGVDFSGADNAGNPEITIIALESTKGRTVNSAFGAPGNKRKHAWQGAQARAPKKGTTDMAFTELVRQAA